MSLTAALTCGLVSIVVSPAQATDTLPDGGGWAHAGAHDSVQAKSNVTAQAGNPVGYTVFGIDVSSHDHSTFPIDWQGVANSGVKFAYVKATEGQNYVNPYFANDNRDSKAAGLLTGAYSYGRPDKRDPVGDANFFIDNAAWANDSRTLIPFLDMEWPWMSGMSTCYGLTKQEMADWIQSFLSQVWVRIGRNAMIYTNPNWWNQCVDSSRNFGAYPLDTSHYSDTSPGALPNGWQNWTLWQYAAGVNSQQGNYDKDVFNGDYQSLQRLAGVDPPPPLTSKPVVSYHPDTRRLEVFANAGGALVERFWDPTYGWSGWTNFGGNITGAPTVFNSPVDGTTDIYANSGGHLVLNHRYNGLWSGWIDLGGTLTGEPAVIYNPRYGTIEVYARSGNHLVYRFYAGGWSGWMDLGGDVAGDPTVFYNPRYGTTEIYVRSSNNHVSYKLWTSGWSGWMDLGGDMTGDPTVIYNPRYGTTEIYVRSSNNHVSYKLWTSGWSGWMDLDGNVTGDPTVIYNPSYGTTEIYANAGGHVVEKFWGSGWSGWMDLGGTITGDPAVIYYTVDTNTDIFATSGGNLVEKFWNTRGGGWSGWINLRQ